jgi:hypothetical protein
MIVKKYVFWGVLAAGLLFSACNRKKTSLPLPNKSEVKEIQKQLDIKIKRYEQALNSISKDSLESGLKKLQKEYACFIGNDLKEAQEITQSYLNDKIVNQLYNEIQKKFPDLTEMETQFAEAFSLLLYYFPDAIIPQVYTGITRFDYNEPIKYDYDTVLFISLDLYLGKDYKLYRQLGMEVPQFIKRRFSQEYILPNCFGEMSYKYINAKPLQSNLLDAMVLEGKRLLFMEMMLPNVSDTLLFPFPQQQIEWAKTNEANIWGYLIQKNYLYSREKAVIRKWVGDAPFTSFFGNQSPGQVGAWMGWRICRSWVAKNPQRKVTELFNETDAQKILTESKYKPQK